MSQNTLMEGKQIYSTSYTNIEYGLYIGFFWAYGCYDVHNKAESLYDYVRWMKKECVSQENVLN